MAVGLDTGVPWVMCKEEDAPDPVVSYSLNPPLLLDSHELNQNNTTTITSLDPSYWGWEYDQKDHETSPRVEFARPFILFSVHELNSALVAK